MTAEPSEPEPRYERFRLVYPSGTVVHGHYCGGLTLEEVQIAHPLAAACAGVGGITPAQFRALLSAEDAADIEAGGIHPKTLHGYAELFAEGIRSGRIGAPVHVRETADGGRGELPWGTAQGL